MSKGMILQFKVTNQSIERLDSLQVFEKSQGYLYAHFIFSEDWQGYTKTVKFSNVLTDSYIGVTLGNENKCLVPYTMILYPAMSICIEGVNDTNIITTNSIAIDIDKSNSTAPSHELPITNITSNDDSIIIERDEDKVDLTLPNRAHWYHHNVKIGIPKSGSHSEWYYVHIKVNNHRQEPYDQASVRELVESALTYNGNLSIYDQGEGINYIHLANTHIRDGNAFTGNGLGLDEDNLPTSGYFELYLDECEEFEYLEDIIEV